MICGQSNSSKEVIWLKNGDVISQTFKTNFLSRYLHISCLESSDSGEYVCKDNVTSSNYIVSFRLTVRNPSTNTIHNYCVIVYTRLIALYSWKVKSYYIFSHTCTNFLFNRQMLLLKLEDVCLFGRQYCHNKVLRAIF